MVVYESSDWHTYPHDLSSQVRNWIAEGKKEQAILIGNGDLSEFMYCRWQDFVGSIAVRELEKALDGYPFTYIANNHDPIRFVRRVYAHIPNIEIVEEKDVMVGDTLYHFEHGSRFAIDWRLLQMVNHWIASWFPDCWLWWQKVRGRLPSQLKERAGGAIVGKESERYRHHTGIIWGNALRDALKRNAVTVIGHTHTYGKHELARGPVWVDGGDMQKDCDYLRITEQGVEHLWAILKAEGGMKMRLKNIRIDEASMVQQFRPLLVLYPEIRKGTERKVNEEFPEVVPLNCDYHPRDIRIVLDHCSLHGTTGDARGWD